jgi:hypothetical protein
MFATLLFATTFFEDVGGKALATFLLGCWLISRFLKSNPGVGDAAKKAAAKKSIDIISRFFK